MVGRGGEADIACGHPPSGRHHCVAGGKVLAGAADVALGGYGFVDADRVAVARGVLLQQDGVGAWRNHAAGEDAHGLAGADAAVERMAGGRAADHAQGRAERAVGRAQGVAVHRRDVRRRLGEAGEHRGGGDTVPRLGEGDDLGRGRAERGEDFSPRFFDADHPRGVQVGSRGIIVCLVAWVGRRSGVPPGQVLRKPRAANRAARGRHPTTRRAADRDR